jgi:two-component system LytT family response regulator
MREDGEYEVLLEPAQRLRMSRRYRKSILERLSPAQQKNA